MPELPEVETIRKQLVNYLGGHKITEVDAHYKNFDGDTKNLVGGNVKKIRRFGKVLSIDLTNGYSLVIHIKLTGQLVYRGPNLLKAKSLSPKVSGGLGGKHTHVIFYLDRGGKLFYNDVRKFGWIKIVKTSEVENIDFIRKLGPEPLVAKSSSRQATLTLDLFKKILSKSGRPIKVVLMDQEKIGGVGNIYANNALWLAKIHPQKSSSKLSDEEIAKLYKAVIEVLKEGLKWRGASELSYVTPNGQEGEYQKHSLAYGREADTCQRCHKAKFVKIFLAGRGTYFCPICQVK